MLNVQGMGAALTAGGYSLLPEARACPWRLGLPAGDKGLLLEGSLVLGLLLEARACCWGLGIAGAGGNAMVSLKALRVTRGSTGGVEPCDSCWRAPDKEVMSLAWEMCFSLSFSLFFNGM